MTTKETLISLAKEKNFQSELLSTEPWKYSLREETRYYLWMCELQRWLMSTHGFYVMLDWWKEDNSNIIEWSYTVYDLRDEDRGGGTDNYYSSPEQALEAGLIESLNLITE